MGLLTLDLRALRKDRGLTQCELARLLGVKQNRISQIERRVDSISVGQLVQLLDTIGYQLRLEKSDDWKTPLTECGAFVYVMPHTSLPLLKIGKANQVDVRAEQVGAVDVPATMRFLVETERDAFRVERVLHRTFHQWRLQAGEAARLGLSTGLGEWFRDDCFPRLMSFAETNQDLLGLKLQTADTQRSPFDA